jgi:hypothetical protein
MHTKYWMENLKGTGHTEDLGTEGKIILGWESVDWMQLAQDRDQ